MEFYITIALCVDAAIFLAYLIFAGMGLLALKIIAAVLCIALSGAALYQLFVSHELLRRRSLWMSLSAACIILCILISLLLNFPSPPYTLPQI
jgi:hypothetical protein